MALLIGIDEAGLGPNLGPYVVTATVWEVPGKPRNVDFWKLFESVLTSTPEADDSRLHIGDSKAVFQPANGIAALERGVLAALRLLPDALPATDGGLRKRLSHDGDCHTGDHPWYVDNELPLPVDNEAAPIERVAEEWRTLLQNSKVQLRGIRLAILEPRRFNALIDRHQNKAEALSTVSLQVLKSAVSYAGEQPVIAWCDKHGGRNRYDLLLSQCFEEEFVFRVRESAELSVYRLGKLEVRFLPRAESLFPVALASMISKYVRELAMKRFNRFWAARVPDLRPTQGYPVDARRFREAISAEQQRLGIPDEQLWRCR